jgi:hypothetical protein
MCHHRYVYAFFSSMFGLFNGPWEDQAILYTVHVRCKWELHTVMPHVTSKDNCGSVAWVLSDENANKINNFMRNQSRVLYTLLRV